MSDKTTVRGPARASGEGGGAGGALRPPLPPVLAGHSVLLCASERADDAPPCVRELGARLSWAELRAPSGGLAEVVRDALVSLGGLEEVLARLGDSAGAEGAYQVRLAEGLAHSLRDVLDEFGREAELSARGAWWVPLCRQG